MLFYSESTLQLWASRRLQDSKQYSSVPLHSSGGREIPSRHSFVEVSSVRTTRTFSPDIPLCPEALNCSRLHPSEHLSNMSGRLSVFDKLKDFFPKHRYWKTVATSQKMCVPVRALSLIGQLVHTKFNRSNISLHGPNAQALKLKLHAVEMQPFGR